MPRHSIYFTVTGCDIGRVAAMIGGKLRHLVGGRQWSRSTHVIDQQLPPHVSIGRDDLADWDLGVIHVLPDTFKGNTWFTEVEHIAVQIDQIAASTGRDFVVALADVDAGTSEDLVCLDGGGVDLEKLRGILEIPPTP